MSDHPHVKRKNNKQHFKMLLRDPVLLITILLIFIGLFLFVLLPFINVFKTSLQDNNGAFSFTRFWDILSNRGYLKTLGNSLLLGAIVAVIATLLGYIFAYATSRVAIPGKRFFNLIATLPIVSPPFILSLSMIFLFGRQGLITKKLFGIMNFDVYGLGSLIVVQSMSFFPVAYLALTGILTSIDSSVEDAAINMGASRWKVFRTITLPLSKPGIYSSLLLVFIQSLEDFSNPAVIGGKFSTLSVESYRMITGMYDTQGGAILAIMLLVPVLIAFFAAKIRFGRQVLCNRYGQTATRTKTANRKKKRTLDDSNLWRHCSFYHFAVRDGVHRRICQNLGREFFTNT